MIAFFPKAFGGFQVFGSVNAHRFGMRGADVNAIAGFQPTQLFQGLHLFVMPGRQLGYLKQNRPLKPVNAQMLEKNTLFHPLFRRYAPQVGNGRPAEIQGLAGSGFYGLHDVRIVQGLGIAEADNKGTDICRMIAHQRCHYEINLRRVNKRLIALYIDNQAILRVLQRHFRTTVRAAEVARIGQDGFATKPGSRFQDALIVGGDAHLVNLAGLLCPFVDMLYHRLASQ